MSSLLSSLAHSRPAGGTDESPQCFSVAEGVSAVTLVTWNNGSWVLPWVHLLGAHHSAHAEAERIALLFAQHEVTAEGLRLALLLPEIAAARLTMLRELPERFAADCAGKGPWVLRLTVKVRSPQADLSRSDNTPV